MQIKVNNTKMHKIVYKGHDPEIQYDQPVAEAKLVLVANYIMNDLSKLELFGTIAKTKLRLGDVTEHLTILQEGYINYLPILISETEKIEEGDLKYCFNTNTILPCRNENCKDCFKILALPEHFSPKHLQAVVDGKMKDDDKVLVECEMMCPNKDGGCEEFNKTGKECTHLVPWIKLNSSNHITLHKTEEKMYTREEVFGIVVRAISAGKLHEYGQWISSDKEWFEQNVK